MAKNEFKPTPGDRNQMTEIDTDDFDDEQDIDIEVEDDTPEEDRGRPKELDYSLADQEEDLRGVAEKTKKRIDRLRFETHTERRRAEEAERQRDEAIEHAKKLQSQFDDLRKRSDTGATALAASMKSEREAALKEAKRRYAAANADGDSDAMAEATSDISRLNAELVEISARTPKKPEGDQSKPQEQQRQPERQQPQLARNVAAWIDHNRNWFQKDTARTNKAMSIHYDLVADGIAPETDKYIKELDKRLKAVYPDHQPYGYLPDDDDDSDGERGGERGPRRSNAVTEGGRETGRQQDKRKVTLTSSQLAIAKKLGLTPQAYAKSLVEWNKRHGEGA